MTGRLSVWLVGAALCGLPLSAAAEDARTVSLQKIVGRIDADRRWAAVRSGPFCLPNGRLAWARSGGEVKTDALVDIFREEMLAGGFKVEGDPDNLFEEAASFSEYVIAGAVRDASGSLCFTGVPKLGGGGVKGEATLTVEWQIYSRLQRQVVAKIPTESRFEAERALSGGAEAMVREAFRRNVRALIADKAFRDIYAGAPRAASATTPAPGLSRIALGGPDAGAGPGVADAVGAVVLVLAGDGHGSGFLVSSDGYVMTDQHVVGSANRVTIRWPDGIETVGEVVRTDRVRDVALIRTDARGREPLPLRTDSLRPGDSVYAVGAPLEQRFQSTVTRGVVSAYRTIEGLRYLQSDVAISPGNSGGPLLDEKGAVVALSKSTYRVDDVPTGINFFTPVRDALDFLGADVRKF